MGSVDVTVSVEIERPAPEVFSFLTDAANNPRWQKGMRSCTWTTPPPIRLGSVYEQEAAFMGRSITTTFEVIEFEPNRMITIDSRQSTFPITVTRSTEPITDQRCRATAHVRGEPSGVMGLLTPLTTRMVRSSVTQDYSRLKSLLEG